VIDIHTHFMAPEHWGKEYARHWTGPYGGDWPTITPAAFDAAMAPVDVAVVFGITACGAGVHTPSRAVAQFCARLTTPTVMFMALDPGDARWPDQLEEGLELGMAGVKLYPVMGHFDPSDRRFDPFYGRLVDASLPVLWHIGATPHSPGRLRHSHPLVIDEVATRHPELRQVIAHMGHPWQRDAVQVLRTNRNVVADVSGLWARPMDAFLALVNAQEWGVVDKLVFGSDYPLWTPEEAVAGLRRVAEVDPGGSLPRVDPQTIETIMASDPLRVLGIAAPDPTGAR
jgi:predicted TIM-barrel fold metal-dependent hydrolase